ncbi:unnamed protein product [Adineta steineri]|uniref:Uncharacterized protein n=1 Tax=Adineta steineri TaxID=433720 RepID=A0A814NAH4_9BILA|nr:unnamed protein product [Adineta steineri]CAF1501863.1 unnamed protein product [Adineta steineri]
MNKLSLLLAFLGCILISGVVSETKFEFPVKECATSIATSIYTGCMVAMAQSIYKVHQWGEDTPMTICGQGITGESSALSRDGAMKGALENWMAQASQAGKINVEDFKC